MVLKTSQEKFWAKSFGDNYTYRNIKTKNRINIIGRDLMKNKIKINSALELGCNVGYNLDALKNLYPYSELFGVEINKKSYDIVKKKYKCYNESFLEFKTQKKFDLVFTSAVLIHQDPKYLSKIYKKIYSLSKKYIYINEYFNPTPVEISYRGHKKKLFKRDFAKELWKKYPKLKLINYGFHWKEDPKKKNNCDNSNLFLFKK